MKQEILSRNATDKTPIVHNETRCAWIAQARHAISQGQTLNEFVAHCHPSNRKRARSAYITAQARGILK